MAIDKNDYPNVIEANLWANEDYIVFFYNFMFEKKRYRGLIDFHDKLAWGKKDRISGAKGELVRIKNEKKDSTLNTNITLEAYMEEYWKNQPEGQYTTIRKSHYTRYVKKYCGSIKLVDLRQKHIEDVLKKQEEIGLAPRTRKQTTEALNPAMKKAIANRMIQFNPCDGIKIKLPNTKKIVVNAVTKLNTIFEAIEIECKFHSHVSSCFTFMFPLVSQTCFHLFHSMFPLGNNV